MVEYGIICSAKVKKLLTINCYYICTLLIWYKPRSHGIIPDFPNILQLGHVTFRDSVNTPFYFLLPWCIWSVAHTVLIKAEIDRFFVPKY